MKRPLLLDLFCGAGGAAMGYWRAGFDVVGVDIKKQPRYPFDFVQGDALNPPVDLSRFDVIHASPPCERYSQSTAKKFRENHLDGIEPTRLLLRSSSKPYIIENVPSAAKLLIRPLMLCGSQFNLRVRRHRFFELSFSAFAPLPKCQHDYKPVLITGTHRRTYEPRYEYSAQECRDAADLQWMRRVDMDKAIPPAYTEFIGKQLIALISSRASDK